MKLLDAIFVYHLVEHERVAWHGRYHSHGFNEYEVHFFLDGTGTFLSGTTRYHISAQKFFITYPEQFHSIIPEKDGTPITYYAFLFNSSERDEDLARLFAEIPEKNAADISIESTYRLQCDEITTLFRSEDAALARAAEYALISLLFRIYRNNGLRCLEECGAGKPESYAVKHSGHAHVLKALHIMQKNVRTTITVDELAELLSLSQEHFIRTFREEVKLTPHQYMLRLKVEGASGFLISTAKSVGEIAEWFGFENQFHFSRCFKKCTGVSPLEYRKSYLQAEDFSYEREKL